MSLWARFTFLYMVRLRSRKTQLESLRWRLTSINQEHISLLQTIGFPFRIIVNSWLFSNPPNANVGSVTILFAPSCNIVSSGRLANTKVGRVDSLFQVRSIILICGLCEKRSFSKLETWFKRKYKCWSDGKLSSQDCCRTGNMFSSRLSCKRFLSPEKAAGCISRK